MKTLDLRAFTDGHSLVIQIDWQMLALPATQTCINPLKPGGGHGCPPNMFFNFFSDIFASNTSKFTDFYFFELFLTYLKEKMIFLV